MKKVYVVNIKTNQSYEGILEDPTNWINDCISNNYWGLPERWVQADSDSYEESDILEREERFFNSGVVNQNEDGTFTSEKSSQTWVKLKADYVIEIIDLERDYDWLLSECHRKRKEEYPKMEDYLDAVVKNDEEQKQKYIDKCLEVKRKYPKPVKGEI